MFDQKYFSTHLKELREKKGVSLETVAKAIGLSRPTVNLWETGGRLPSIAALWKLADYFNVSIDELIGRIR